MMKTAKLGSSSNANKNPYSKFGFEGTDATQKTFAKIKAAQDRATLDLMSPEAWSLFCLLRRTAA